MKEELLERFRAKMVVDPNTACWLWTGAKTARGYGNFHCDGRAQRAHRVAYEHFRGPIPDGLELDHICRTRSCVNPWHLEPVTHLENVRRGNAGINSRAKTHCPQGHAYEEHARYRGNGGWRSCGECQKARNRLQHLRRRAAWESRGRVGTIRPQRSAMRPVVCVD